MKKHIRVMMISMVAVLSLIVSSCTQNGGYIGDLFGRWHLVEIEANNMEAPAQAGEIYWAFQGDMFQMQLDRGEHSVSTTYGLYTLEDDILTLKFPEEGYPPFPQTGLARENRLEVLKLNHGEMILVYHPADDATLTYYLRKW